MLAFAVLGLCAKTFDHKKINSRLLFRGWIAVSGKDSKIISQQAQGSTWTGRGFNGQLPSLIWRLIDCLSSGLSLIYSFPININKSLPMATPAPVTSCLVWQLPIKTSLIAPFVLFHFAWAKVRVYVAGNLRMTNTHHSCLDCRTKHFFWLVR